MPKYIDMTPKWSEVLPMWQLIISRSCKVINKKAVLSRGAGPVDGDGNFERFWTEMRRMAQAADNWHDYCREVEIIAGVDEMQRVNEGLLP